jgi:hypothetical protein
MADDDQTPENGQHDGHPNGQADAQLVTQLLQQFTAAIRDLADGRQPSSPDDEARRARLQRIDFGYLALGALMGRVSRTPDREFDVPTFAACWDDDRRVIHLFGLHGQPEEKVTWVELRAPATRDCPAVQETVKVVHGRGETDAGRKSRSAQLVPKEIGPDRAIESMVGLGGLTGPLLAFGPRLAPRPDVNAK